MTMTIEAVGSMPGQPVAEGPHGDWNRCTPAELRAVLAFHKRLPTKSYDDDETLFGQWRRLPFFVDTIQLRVWNAACEHFFVAYPPGPLAARRFGCMPGTADSVTCIAYGARLMLGYFNAPDYAAFFIEHVYDDWRDRPTVLDQWQDSHGTVRDVSPRVVRENKHSMVVRCTVRQGVLLYEALVEVGYGGEARIVRRRALQNRFGFLWREWTRKPCLFRTECYSDG